MMCTENASLKRKNDMLTNTLHHDEKEKGNLMSEIHVLNEKLQTMQNEMEKVTKTVNGTFFQSIFLTDIYNFLRHFK